MGNPEDRLENGGDEVEGVDEALGRPDTNFRPLMGIGNLLMNRVVW